MGSMGEEMQVLRTRAEDATRLETELKEATANTARLEGLYQVEQVQAGGLCLILTPRNSKFPCNGTHVAPIYPKLCRQIPILLPCRLVVERKTHTGYQRSCRMFRFPRALERRSEVYPAGAWCFGARYAA